MMMFTCMQPRGLCHKFIRGEGAQELHEDFGLLVIDHDSNDKNRTEKVEPSCLRSKSTELWQLLFMQCHLSSVSHESANKSDYV